jgi:hypothetical protein
LSSFGVSPAAAQNGADAFFGIAGALIQHSIAVEQENKRQQQVLRRQYERQEAQKAADQQFTTRMQSALARLGFYRAEVDGKAGPATRAALTDYQRAFHLVTGKIGDSELEALEARAVSGWRSADEQRQAEMAGFDRRDEYLAARQAGFSQQTEWRRAKAQGFDSAKDYQAFLASGLTSKAAYDQQKQAVAAISKAADQCNQLAETRQWLTALEPCFTAVQARPDDVALTTLLNAVRKQAETLLADSRSLLKDKQEELAKAVSSGNHDADGLRREITKLNNNILLAQLRLRAARCGDLIDQSDWKTASTECYYHVSVSHLSGDEREHADNLLAALSQHRQKAMTALKAEKEKAEAEAERLALAQAKERASGLLAEVEAYTAEGSGFTDGFGIALSVTALRDAIKETDSSTIEKAIAELDGRLQKESSFLSARKARLAAAKETKQVAARQARQQAEMLAAFVKSYVSAHVMFEGVPQLLSLQNHLAAALKSGNVAEITVAQADGRNAIGRLGLAADLDRFAQSYNAPVLTADQLAEQNAAIATDQLSVRTATEQANDLIAAIGNFAKSGNSFADPRAVAQAITDLREAMKQPEAGLLQSRLSALSTLANADPRFVAASKQREQATDIALANAIADAKEDAKMVDGFLRDYIGKHLADSDIGPIVGLQGGVDDALQAPPSARLVDVVKQTHAGIERLGLADDLDLFAQAAQQSSEKPSVATADNGIAITIANEALLEGNPGDLLVLRNASGSAPHLALDLTGNLMVQGGSTAACWPYPVPDETIQLLMAKQQLVKKGIEQVAWSQCSDRIDDTDLMVMERGAFLALAPSAARPIISAFEDGRLQTLIKVTSDEADEKSNAYAVETASLQSRIQNKTLKGFGILKIDRGKSDICMVVDDAAPHANLLAADTDELAFFIDVPRIQKPTTATKAFVAAQRGDCAAIYGGVDDLRELMTALDRDAIDYRLLPIWIDLDEVKKEETRLAELSKKQVEAETLRRQRLESEAKLAATKRADLMSAAQKRQAELRATYGEEATGAEKTVADMVRHRIWNGPSDALQGFFPAVDSHSSKTLTDHWKFTDMTDELVDYGTASWQGRRTKAIVSTLRFKRENAILGLYAEDCFTLTYLIDEEFRTRRDALSTQCSDTAALDEWLQGHDFDSLWVVRP